jgi:GGDEF domain-containing protein
MVDGSGTVLAREPHGANWPGRSFKDHPMINAALATSEGTYTGPSIDGVRRIFGFVQLPGTTARLAVGFDESDVLRRVTRESVTAFTGLGVLTVLVLIAIWFGGQRLFVEPIRLLTRTAQQFGRGEFKARAATLPWATEFVPLAAALDDMAGQLATREQNLLDSNGQLQELVNVDGLTGIANRRSFNARLADEWRRGAKLNEPIALLMIDVDHFKAFNDRYGHAQGDVCLRNVSHALTSKARVQVDAREGAPDATMPPSFRRFAERDPDFVARYGGEEFVVLLQGATAENALKVAERLRRAVEEAHVIHESAPRGFVTISIGVASVVPEAAKSPHELIDAADAALYEAKRRGRNRVVAQPAATLREVG